MFVSLQFKLKLRKEDKEKLMKFMRKQPSAIRTAYNMLKKLEKDKTKKMSTFGIHRLDWLMVSKRFPWNGKYETVYRCHLYHHGPKK
jgi:hypothetical protein